MKSARPSRPFDPSAARASTITNSPLPALMNCLRPVRRQPSPSFVAVVAMLPTSLPACGSVIATAPLRSPRTTGGTQRRFCSSVPKRMIIAAGSVYPIPNSTIVAARARDHLYPERVHGLGEATALERLRQREADESELREPAQVLLHRLARLDPSAVADHAELVDLLRASRDLGPDVLARDGEHLPPGRNGVLHVGLRALRDRHELVPVDDLVERLDEVGVVEEVVHG